MGAAAMAANAYGQIAGAGERIRIGVIGCGVQVHQVHLFGATLDLGALACPVTLLWLLGTINAFNLLDGLDGLLGCVGLILTLTLTAMAILGGHWRARGGGVLSIAFPPMNDEKAERSDLIPA